MVLVACLVSVGLTAASLRLGPGVYSDPGFGFLAWRSFLSGAPFNHILEPDPADIAQDRATFLAYWSPGQYLVPGIISFLGVRMGTAMVLTTGAALLVGLMGWLRIAKAFSFPPAAAFALVAAVPLFRFSTHSFGMYSGGEPLLQAALPWMILLAVRVPRLDAFRAALVAFAVVAFGFFAKITGVIAACAALGAACLPQLVEEKRLSAGMVFGAVGAAVSLVLVYALWLSQGATAAGAPNGESLAANVGFMLLAPWTAGLSLLDLFSRIFLHPSNPILRGPGDAVWLLAPFAGLVACMLFVGREQRAAPLQRWLSFAGIFAVLYGAAMLVLMLGLAAVSMEERHVRPVGMVILASLLVVSMTARRHTWRRWVVAGLCLAMAAYGAASFAFRALSTHRADAYDTASATQQLIVDLPALEFMRTTYALEGRDALFVLPSPEAALALPLGARIIAKHLDFTPESEIARLRFKGVAKGTVHIVMQTRLVGTTKGQALLAAFVDYDVSGWQIHSSGETSLLVQKK
jgi:hypothetical protein